VPKWLKKSRRQRISAKFLRFPRETKQVKVKVEVEVEVKIEVKIEVKVEVQQVDSGGECY